MPRVFYPQRKCPRCPWYSSLGGSQNRSGRGGEEKKILSQESKPRTPIVHPAYQRFKVQSLSASFVYLYSFVYVYPVVVVVVVIIIIIIIT